MTNPQDRAAADRELVIFGEDTGTVVYLSYAAAPRPAVRRAVVFLSTGETLSVDPASGGETPRLRAARTDARRRQIHMSATAMLTESPVGLGDTARAPGNMGRPVPLGLTIGIEGVDEDPWPRPTETDDFSTAAAAVRFSGSITTGSLIYADDGLGWTVSDASHGASPGSRLFGAFQDGTGLCAAGGADTPAEQSTAVTLAGSKSAHAPVFRLLVDRTGPSPVLACTIGGAAPVDVAGEVRHVEQRVDHLWPDGDGRLASSLYPFVLVRAGITGIGLVEHVAAADSLYATAVPGDGLPDPY